MSRLCQLLAGALLGLALTSCSEVVPVYHESGKPQRLSDWQLFQTSSSALLPAAASVVVNPSNPLFSDYAQKLRTVWLPEDAQISVVDAALQYPVGTVLSKTFYYPRANDGKLLATAPASLTQIDLAANRLLETRLLVRRPEGWVAFPYVWNDTQDEAFLRVAGDSSRLDVHLPDGNETRFTYFVPNENQCAGCHVTEHPAGQMQPLGAIASQLGTQLQQFQARGWLTDSITAAARPSWLDANQDLQTRASEYLNINCGHCHNPRGAADTSALILDGSHNSLTQMGLCKPPVAAGGGSGNLLYSIVPGDAERSILLYRMRSTAPDEMMPELGRSLVHSEGVRLVQDWIASLPGACQ